MKTSLSLVCLFAALAVTVTTALPATGPIKQHLEVEMEAAVDARVEKLNHVGEKAAKTKKNLLDYTRPIYVSEDLVKALEIYKQEENWELLVNAIKENNLNKIQEQLVSLPLPMARPAIYHGLIQTAIIWGQKEALELLLADKFYFDQVWSEDVNLASYVADGVFEGMLLKAGGRKQLVSEDDDEIKIKSKSIRERIRSSSMVSCMFVSPDDEQQGAEINSISSSIEENVSGDDEIDSISSAVEQPATVDDSSVSPAVEQQAAKGNGEINSKSKSVRSTIKKTMGKMSLKCVFDPRLSAVAQFGLGGGLPGTKE